MRKTSTPIQFVNSNRLQSPLIIIGMHRSGTSLLTRLLTDLGLFSGADWDRENAESIFFRDRNDAVLSDQGASWYQPDAIRQLLDNPGQIDSIASRLADHCRSHRFSRYVGKRTQQKDAINGGWGWKDPRNTLTLPLWLHVFPQAKVLHVIRNGVDVSQSLVTRERRILNKPWVRFRRKFVKPFIPERWLPPRSDVCSTRENAFGLWVKYLDFAINATHSLSAERFFAIRFEDLIDAPVDHLRSIARFAALDATDERLYAAVAKINIQRKYAFQDDIESQKFYDARCKHPMMKRFEYDQLCASSRVSPIERTANDQCATGHQSADDPIESATTLTT